MPSIGLGTSGERSRSEKGTNMSSLQKKMLGQIVALTKNIRLIKPTHRASYIAQFSVGKQSAWQLLGSFGIEWWHTNESFRAREAIADLLICSASEFSDCDSESVEEAIDDTLHEICVDKRMFEGDEVCFAKKPTLFDCRTGTDVASFARGVHEAIVETVRLRLTRWCVAHPIPRICGETFDISSWSVGAIDKDDKAAWEKLHEKGYATQHWSLPTGNFLPDGRTYFSALHYRYVLVAEAVGTQKGAKFSAEQRFKTLAAVMCACLSDQRGIVLQEASERPHRHSIQFPQTDRSALGATIGEITPVIPYYIRDHQLENQDITAIQQWFAFVLAMPHETRHLAEKCAHFVNRAMNVDGEESYLNFYRALDALYGVRGLVEASISAGIAGLHGPPEWSEKAGRLFDLRNEIVHGGSRHIAE